MTLADFLENAMPEPNSGCWLWLLSLNDDGYGRARLNGKRTSAQRVAYELAYGAIRPDLHLDHKCRVRCCVNPDHLEPVTPGVNVARGVSPIATNMRATHCKHGHPFSGDNLHTTTDGERVCRACGRRRAKKGQGAMTLSLTDERRGHKVMAMPSARAVVGFADRAAARLAPSGFHPYRGSASC